MPTACSPILKAWLTAGIMELMSRYLQRYLDELVFRFNRATYRWPLSGPRGVGSLARKHRLPLQDWVVLSRP
jgi:hypothetical protein